MIDCFAQPINCGTIPGHECDWVIAVTIPVEELVDDVLCVSMCVCDDILCVSMYVCVCACACAHVGVCM